MKKYISRTKGFGRKVGLMAVSFLCLATSAVGDAAGNSGSGGLSPLMIVFLAFIGVFVLMQLIPAAVIFGSLVSAVFKKSKKSEENGPVNERI